MNEAFVPRRDPFEHPRTIASFNDPPARSSRGTRATQLVAIGVVFAVVATSHRTSAFLHPEFYAEDGQDWFANARDVGWPSLLWPLGGYLVVFQRVWGLLLAPFGLHGAALGFAVVAMLAQIAPPLLFSSARFRPAVASDRLRTAIGFTYLAIPNAEMSGNLTNTQWALAALAFLIVVAPRPATAVGAAIEIATLVIASVSGPYAWFLLPLVVAWGWRKRTWWWWTRMTVVTIGAGAQALVFIFHSGMRVVAAQSFGARATELPFIIANQIVYRFFGVSFEPKAMAGALAITVLVACLLILGYRHGPRALRYFIIFAILIAGGGFVQPYEHYASAGEPWLYMASGQGFSRYFFFLTVAIVLCALQVGHHLTAQLTRSRLRERWSVHLVLGSVCLVAVLRWQYPALVSEHLTWYQAELQRAPAGTSITIPIDPRGWTMTVITRQ